MKRMLLTASAVAIALLWTVTASADTWNERTTLTFSDAVLVPGATLPAGTYEFQLADSPSAPHLVRIRNKDGQIVVSAPAVPIKRLDSKSDTVVKFAATDAGAPPALKAWFYPNSLYGHEFVYPEDQARKISERTKTVVLSTDAPDSDLQKGTLRTITPTGQRTAWKGDDATLREWNDWQRARQSAARNSSPSSPAPLVESDFQGTRVKLDDLESNTQKYVGQTVSVDGEVQRVLGPRLLTIDEANWADLDREVLVLLPAKVAAAVRTDDKVTVSGTVKPFVRAEIEKEWGWLGLEPAVVARFSRRAVLVADRIVGGNDKATVIIDVENPSQKRQGITGETSALTDVKTIAGGEQQLVGRHVSLAKVAIDNKPMQEGGFLVGDAMKVFVLPALPDQAQVRAGDTVMIEGIILQMPNGMEKRVATDSTVNSNIYIYATRIEN
jgi:hypothetical protein